MIDIELPAITDFELPADGEDAIDMFTFQIKKYIGAYAASLGPVGALILQQALEKTMI